MYLKAHIKSTLIWTLQLDQYTRIFDDQNFSIKKVRANLYREWS